MRWHAKWQNVGTVVPISLHENGLLTSLLVRALGLDVSEGTHYHRDAVDGLPSGDRYQTACLGRIGRNFPDLHHLGLDLLCNPSGTRLWDVGNVPQPLYPSRVS